MLGSGDVRNFRSQQHPKILLCSTVKLRIPKVHRTPHTHRVRFAITDTENETESAAYLVSKHALLTVICFCHYYCSCITTVQTLPHNKKTTYRKKLNSLRERKTKQMYTSATDGKQNVSEYHCFSMNGHVGWDKCQHGVSERVALCAWRAGVCVLLRLLLIQARSNVCSTNRSTAYIQCWLLLNLDVTDTTVKVTGRLTACVLVDVRYTACKGQKRCRLTFEHCRSSLQHLHWTTDRKHSCWHLNLVCHQHNLLL